MGDLISKRLAVFTEAEKNSTIRSSCAVEVVKEVDLQFVQRDEGVVLQLFSRYTGFLFQSATVILENWAVISCFGILGALILSFLIVICFAACVQCAVITFLLVMVLSLGALDYVLFVKADVFT